jgi:hypothetical protein
VHALEHLLNFRERLIGLFPGSAPEFDFDYGAEHEQLGAVFLVTLAGGQQEQTKQSSDCYTPGEAAPVGDCVQIMRGNGGINPHGSSRLAFVRAFGFIDTSRAAGATGRSLPAPMSQSKTHEQNDQQYDWRDEVFHQITAEPSATGMRSS